MPSPLPFALLAHLALAAASPQAAVEEALTPGRRAEVAAPQVSSGRDCRPETWSTLRPATASGPAALRFAGTDAGGGPCEGFAWARVTVHAPAPVITRALEVGDPLEGAVAWQEREVRPGRLPPATLPVGATAARRLQPGAVLDEASYRIGPRPGTALPVVLRTGALSIEQEGRAAPCARGFACAVLPSGRRVEGRLVDGRLLVEVP
jgi:flagella basal body P-ring formation protein FlgA